MDIGIPPLKFKTLLESNSATSRILVRAEIGRIILHIVNSQGGVKIISTTYIS